MDLKCLDKWPPERSWCHRLQRLGLCRLAFVAQIRFILWLDRVANSRVCLTLAIHQATVQESCPAFHDTLILVSPA